MSYVIFNKETTRILQAPARSVGCYIDSYKSESAAKAALTRLDNKGKLGSSYSEVPATAPNGMKYNERVETPYVKSDFSIAEASVFRDLIEKMETKRNMMSGESFTQPVNTSRCCDPSSELYWSM